MSKTKEQKIYEREKKKLTKSKKYGVRRYNYYEYRLSEVYLQKQLEKLAYLIEGK